MEKVWEAPLRENYAAIVGEVAPRDLPSVVQGLESWFRDHIPAAKMSHCDICDGWSDESLPACPYCADGKKDGVEIDAIAIVSSGVELAETSKRRKKTEPKSELSSKESKATEIACLPVDAEPRLVTDHEKQQAKTKAAKSTPAPSLLAGGRNIASEVELDEAIAKFKAEIASGSSSYYRAGVHLVRIRDRLWQQRTTEGKPKYKSFEQFCREEFDISKTLAYRIMRVCESFSQEAFQQYGPRTLMILVSAPKEEHQALLARADAGASTRDLEAEVRQIRRDKGISVIDSDSPAAKASAASAENRENRKKKEAAAITAGFKASTGVVECFAKPAKGAKGDPVPARSIEDGPYCTIECMNDVKIYLAVKAKPTGEIQIRYTVRREEEEE